MCATLSLSPPPPSLSLVRARCRCRQLDAVAAYETLLESSSVGLGEATTTTPSTAKHETVSKGATGKAYKALKKLLDDQCHDRNLQHCGMAKARAADGTIEFVSAASRERFVREGKACLIWNYLAVAQAELKASDDLALAAAPTPAATATDGAVEDAKNTLASAAAVYTAVEVVQTIAGGGADAVEP